MTPDDFRRAELRALQDRWLQVPTVQAHIRDWGWDEYIAGIGSPTFDQVRRTVLPGWREWLEEFFVFHKALEGE